MRSREKILDPYAAGTLHQPVTIHHASICVLHGDGLRNLYNAYAGHLAFTDDQKAEIGTLDRVSSWWLVSPLC